MFDRVVDVLIEGEGRWWLLGALAVVGVAKGGRRLAKGAIKGYLAARDELPRLSEGATRLSQEASGSLQRLREMAAGRQRAAGEGTAATGGEAGAPA